MEFIIVNEEYSCVLYLNDLVLISSCTFPLWQQSVYDLEEIHIFSLFYDQRMSAAGIQPR